MDAYCNGCKHKHYFGSGETSCCGYILDTGHKRPCPAGAGCTEHTNVERAKQSKPEKPAYDCKLMRKLFFDGKTDKQIAQIVGRSETAICSCRKRNGLKRYEIPKYHDK